MSPHNKITENTKARDVMVCITGQKKRWLKKSLAATFLVSAVLGSAIKPAHAIGIPTTDIANIAEASSTTAEIGSQISSISNTVTKLTSILDIQKQISNTLGLNGSMLSDTGLGTVGQLLSNANAGLSFVQNARSNVETIIDEADSILNNPLNVYNTLAAVRVINRGFENIQLAAGQESTLFSQSATQLNKAFSGQQSVSESTATIQKTLYTTSPGASADQVANTRMVRQAVAQNSAVGGYLASSAQINSLTSSSGAETNAIANLATGVSGSLDTRGDIKANSAIEIKILQQIMLENQMLSWLVRTQTAQAITNQPIYSPTSDSQ